MTTTSRDLASPFIALFNNPLIKEVLANSGTLLTASLYNSEPVPKLITALAKADALTPVGLSNITGYSATVACFVKSNPSAFISLYCAASNFTDLKAKSPPAVNAKTPVNIAKLFFMFNLLI